MGTSRYSKLYVSTGQEQIQTIDFQKTETDLLFYNEEKNGMRNREYSIVYKRGNAEYSWRQVFTFIKSKPFFPIKSPEARFKQYKKILKKLGCDIVYQGNTIDEPENYKNLSTAYN